MAPRATAVNMARIICDAARARHRGVFARMSPIARRREGCNRKIDRIYMG